MAAPKKTSEALVKKRPAGKRITAAERERVRILFERFESLELRPKTELNYSNPYELVTAVALSAQATDVQVNKATGPLFQVADSAEKMLELGEDGLIKYIASIGLFRTKAKNVIASAHILMERYGGQVPLNRQALESLPGVGRKTASVVLSELDVEPAIAVDTHVFRRGRSDARGARSLPDPRAPLADPARPLCLRGPQAQVRDLQDRRPLPVAGAVLEAQTRAPGEKRVAMASIAATPAAISSQAADRSDEASRTQPAKNGMTLAMT
jgi:endonuclease III